MGPLESPCASSAVAEGPSPHGGTATPAPVIARLRAGATCVAVMHPRGAPVAADLQALARRLRPAFRSALIPFPALPAGEVASWALGLLNAPPQGDPEARLLEVARRGPGPVVLVLDEAESLPVATARRLARLLAAAGGHLRLVAACAADDPRAARVLEALGPSEVVRLREAPPPAEGAEEAGRAPEPAVPAASQVRDPLAPTADPARDRPRPALAAAVAGLAADLAAGAPVTVLTGPPGHGKTLGLRLLARQLEREGSRVPVWLPYPALPPEEALGWIAELLAAPAGADPEARLRAVLGGGEGPADGRRVVVLVDEAASLPEATRERLLALARELPGLQLALAWSDAAAQPAERALGATVPCHAVREGLALEDAAGMLAGRLGPAAPAVGDEALGALHREARGNPASLLYAADAWRRPASVPARPSAPTPRPAPDPAAAPPAPARRRAARAAQPAAAPEARPSLRPGLALALLLFSAALFAPRPLGRDADAGPQGPAAAAPVLVDIHARPPARVAVDGRELGATPLRDVPLAPGPRTLRARLADGRRVEATVEVDPAHPSIHIEDGRIALRPRGAAPR